MVTVSRAIRVGLPAPAEARRSVDELAPFLPPDRLQDLRLIVSELVANAVLHAGLDDGDRIRVKLDLSQERVRVEVIDFGRGFTTDQRDAKPEEAGGWGLVIVDRLADRWGREPGPGTRVWAEVSLPEDSYRETVL